MAFIQTRQTSVGDLLTGTYGELAAIKRELAIYFGAFLAAGLVADFVEPLAPLIAVASTVGYFAGQYYLYRAALGGTGVMFDPRFKVFSFFAMACILGLPIYFGFSFLFIPGLLLASKWVMAPTYLVAEEIDLFEAIGSSWAASSHNLLPIALAFTVLTVIWAFLVTGVTLMNAALVDAGLTTNTDGANALFWLAVHLLPVLLMGLSVSAYRALNDTVQDVAAVFE